MAGFCSLFTTALAVADAVDLQHIRKTYGLMFFGVWVSGFGFLVSDLGFLVSGFGFLVSGFWFLVSGF